MTRDTLPAHHIPDVVLMDYAAGNVPEPLALLVATHLALCPACREELREIELIGGALLLDTHDDEMSAPVEFATPRRVVATARPAVPPLPSGCLQIPLPLRGYIGNNLDDLDWRTTVRGVQEFVLARGNHGVKSSLLRIEPGRQMPRHTHLGDEYTLVLQSGFSDQGGHYARGDVAVADASVTHTPVADAGETCICLTAVDAPLQLTGPIGWLVNPFLRR
jgi:putative transcriptional regulator